MAEAPEADAGSVDFIVVGAGSAGCVLAARLSEDPGTRVLLVEAGPRDRSWTIDMPAAMGDSLGGRRFNWDYLSEPEPGLHGRRLKHPRGRVLGGSSSINGMVWIRGHPLDYEGWAAEGCSGWGHGDVLPYFRRLERQDRPESQDGAEGSGAAGEWHGAEGPMRITRGSLAHPLNRAFVEAGVAAGYRRSEDLNGFGQEGFGRLDRSTHAGARWSTARGYLDAAADRPNLRVLTGSLVTRILLEGRRALGVELQRGGEQRRVAARREVIVAAGAINSPQLLQLSGIGPAALLKEHGIAVRHDLPGVGANLQDHPDIVVQQACRRPVSLWPATRAPRRWLVGLQWFLSKSGAAASNLFEAGAFIRSRPGLRQPDLQLTMLPLAIAQGTTDCLPAHAFQVYIDLMRPESRGVVRLRSADPGEPPAIRFGYLESAQDLADLRAGVRLVREVLAQGPMAPFAGEELLPGAAIASDDALDNWIRGSVETGYHYAGSCRMGAEGDPGAVVAPDCRVRGLEGLRVVDASIMPRLVSGNTNAPTIMLAERASDLIRGRRPLEPDPLAFWEPPDWQLRQK